MKKRKKSVNKEIVKITYIFAGLFFLMLGYLAYFNIVVSQDVINSTYNKRQDIFAKKVVRGKILARNGEVLAETVVDSNGNEKRVYPHGRLFAHAVGISNHGKSGVELYSNFSLLRSDTFIMERLSNEFQGKKNIGDNVVTTLDVNVQRTAYDALGANKGAILVMEPDTGRIIAMVSKPDFDPNEIDAIWESIIAEGSEDSSLLNRATNGVYTPGSTFKIFTLLQYIRENEMYEKYAYECAGGITLEEFAVNCNNKTRHGHESLIDSFANSCNASFVNMGTQLDLGQFRNLCTSLLFNTDLPYAMPSKKSSIKLNKDTDLFMTMQTSIGQGETLVTPLHMAMIVSAIANDGVLIKPYMVRRVENYTGSVIKSYRSSKYGELFPKEEAEVLKEYLKAVVEKGTATNLRSDRYQAYGKTGTAQVDSGGHDHSWFVGYADDGEHKVVVSIVMERMPPGSTWAVGVAKSVIDRYYQSVAE